MVFMNFFKHQSSCLAVNGETDLSKKILICVLKMNKSLTGLERHEDRIVVLGE